MTIHSFDVDSEELEELLEEAENKSEVLRRGLQLYQIHESTGEYKGLDDYQSRAYEWIIDSVGANNRIPLDAVKNELAQELSKDMPFVMGRVIKPLHRRGYLRVNSRIARVDIIANPPESVEVRA